MVRYGVRYFFAALVLALLASPLLAQEGSTATTKAGKQITGCVQKGVEHGGYTINDNGVTYELFGDHAKLADDVGKSVAVSGHEFQPSKAVEQKREADEQKEAGGNKYADFRVTGLKVVGSSCQ
jgi:hypothetical protein